MPYAVGGKHKLPEISEHAVTSHTSDFEPVSVSPAQARQFGGTTSRLVAAWLLSKRVYLLVVVHLGILAVCYNWAFQLRFEFSVPQAQQQMYWNSLPWILGLKLIALYCFGSLHGWWRYVNFADLAQLLRVATVSTIAIVTIDHFLLPGYQIPRSVVLLDWGLMVFLVGGLRSTCRLIREHRWPIFSADPRRPALMIGVERGGEALIQLIHNHPRLNYRIVGFLSDDRSSRGSRLGGIPFRGSVRQAVSLAKKQGVRDILVVSHSIFQRRLRNLLDQCRRANIELKMIPRGNELLRDSHRVQVRDVDINDLLRREPVELDSRAIGAMLGGSCVMVTGAGGSIGSEICRQIVGCCPSRLILVERAENSLFHIERELRAMAPELPLIAAIADIGDRERLQAVFREHQVHSVFHAAAHKHVPLMESNPAEAIKNNVFGTRLLVETADRFGVERFIMISTDKAVNPTSVMGVSKLLAERCVHAMSEISRTKCVVVRFGNVLASAGSVVPLFQEQIRRGGPVTVTHPDMERFFMTIPEASQLVLQAAAMGRGGEIFILDMGNPIKIVDLAENLIRLSGLSTEEIEIRFTGIRPGEKLNEELYSEDEETLSTSHSRVRAVYHQPCSLKEVDETLGLLASLIHHPTEAIREQLHKIVPEYLEGESTRRDEPHHPSPARGSALSGLGTTLAVSANPRAAANLRRTS